MQKYIQTEIIDEISDDCEDLVESVKTRSWKSVLYKALEIVVNIGVFLLLIKLTSN